MAIALTEFEALCGFRPLAEILTQLDATPELCEALGEDIVDKFRNANE
jgi:mannose-6-phosphate isomerase